MKDIWKRTYFLCEEESVIKAQETLEVVKCLT